MTTATHTQNEILWSLSPAKRHKTERIGTGRKETIVLTVTVLNPISAGRCGYRGAAAKRWRCPGWSCEQTECGDIQNLVLRDVKTLDLVSRDQTYSSGSYAISVLIS